MRSFLLIYALHGWRCFRFWFHELFVVKVELIPDVIFDYDVFCARLQCSVHYNRRCDLFFLGVIVSANKINLFVVSVIFSSSQDQLIRKCWIQLHCNHINVGHLLHKTLIRLNLNDFALRFFCYYWRRNNFGILSIQRILYDWEITKRGARETKTLAIRLSRFWTWTDVWFDFSIGFGSHTIRTKLLWTLEVCCLMA